MKIEINGNKITVLNVAKLVFTILLGYKIGKYCTVIPESMFEGCMASIEKRIFKKLGVNEGATEEEIQEAAEKAVKKLEQKVNGKIKGVHLEIKTPSMQKEGETES